MSLLNWHLTVPNRKSWYKISFFSCLSLDPSLVLIPVEQVAQTDDGPAKRRFCTGKRVDGLMPPRGSTLNNDFVLVTGEFCHIPAVYCGDVKKRLENESFTNERVLKIPVFLTWNG